MRFYWAAVGLMLAAASLDAQSSKAGVEAWGRGDYAGALASWRPLAVKGDSDAMFNLAQAYRLGRGVTIDLGAAEDWYTRAARAGHVDAQVQLGMLLFQNGDQRAGIQWLKRGADNGEARAQLLYGTALYNGDGGVKRDALAGYAYVSKAAAQGLGPAKTTLADMNREIPPQLRKVALAKPIATKVAQADPPVAPALKRRAGAAKSTRPAPVPVATESAAEGGSWRVQLGAFSQHAAAEALFHKLAAGPLAGKHSYFVPVGAVQRLQVGPYASRASAAAACSTLSARGQACFPVAGR